MAKNLLNIENIQDFYCMKIWFTVSKEKRDAEQWYEIYINQEESYEIYEIYINW